MRKMKNVLFIRAEAATTWMDLRGQDDNGNVFNLSNIGDMHWGGCMGAFVATFPSDWGILSDI